MNTILALEILSSLGFIPLRSDVHSELPWSIHAIWTRVFINESFPRLEHTMFGGAPVVQDDLPTAKRRLYQAALHYIAEKIDHS